MPDKKKINDVPAKAAVLLHKKCRYLDQTDLLVWLAKRNIGKNISRVCAD